MSIFRTINSTHEKSSYTIKITNLDISGNHWQSEKNIVNALSKIDTLLYTECDLDKELVSLAVDISDLNDRITDGKFYRNGSEFIFCAEVKIPSLYKEIPEFLSHKITFSHKKKPFNFTIIELIESEQKELEKKTKELPKEWKFDEAMTMRYNKLMQLVF